MIANTIQNELTLIIDTLAPQKRIQVKNKHADFLTPELTQKIKDNNKLLTTAIQSKGVEDWRMFRLSNLELDKSIN